MKRVISGCYKVNWKKLIAGTPPYKQGLTNRTPELVEWAGPVV